MSFYSIIVRYLFLPVAAKLQKSKILEEYIRLQKIDWYSNTELKSLQDAKLQQLVIHCYYNVPYYTRLFDSLGLKPEDIKHRDDLSKLPVLTKQIIRDNYESLISLDMNQRKVHLSSSGGSTGVPLKFMTDRATWGTKWSSTFRAWQWAGFCVGERIFTFGGNSLVKSKKEKRQFSKKDMFDCFIMNNYKCDCSDLSIEAMAKHYHSLMKRKPKMLRGYPAAIYNMAKYIDSNKLPVPHLKVVETTGEMLLPSHRNAIQQVFRVPVYDNYGAGDGGIISHECYMHEGLHVTEEQCIVEVVDDKGHMVLDGDEGFVLSTDLDNYVFPFIRYQVGDRAIMKKEKCSCGRSSRLIEQIVGRTGKTLFNKAGRPFTSIIIDNMMFKNMDYHKIEHEIVYQKIDQFQVRQDRNGHIAVLIKPRDKDESISTFEYVKDNFQKHFEGSTIEIRFVSSIPKQPSGKEEYCISEFYYEQ